MNCEVLGRNGLKHALIASALGAVAHAACAQATGNTPVDPTQSGTGAATGAVIDKTAPASGTPAGERSPSDALTGGRPSPTDSHGTQAGSPRVRESSGVSSGGRKGARSGHSSKARSGPRSSKKSGSTGSRNGMRTDAGPAAATGGAGR